MSDRKHIDPESLSGIRWWMKKRRKYYFQNFLTVSLILAFFVPLFAQVPRDSFTRSDLLLLIPFALLIICFGVYQLWQWLRTFRLQVDHCWMGTVTDMYRVVKRRRTARSYRILADVGGKEMEGYCQLRTYRMAEKGQKILLFTIGGDTVFCVHPEM